MGNFPHTGSGWSHVDNPAVQYIVLGPVRIKDVETRAWLEGVQYQRAKGSGEAVCYARPLADFLDNFKPWAGEVQGG